MIYDQQEAIWLWTSSYQRIWSKVFCGSRDTRYQMHHGHDLDAFQDCHPQKLTCDMQPSKNWKQGHHQYPGWNCAWGLVVCNLVWNIPGLIWVGKPCSAWRVKESLQTRYELGLHGWHPTIPHEIHACITNQKGLPTGPKLMGLLLIIRPYFFRA